MTAAAEEGSNINVDWGTPHAFHLNLPPNHFDEDGVPYITKFAQKKARMIVDLALSNNLTEAMFASSSERSPNDGEEDAMEVDDDDDASETEDGDSKETLVRKSSSSSSSSIAIQSFTYYCFVHVHKAHNRCVHSFIYRLL